MTKEKELEAKQLVPNKFWIVQNYGQKVGTLQKNKEGYILVTHKDKIHFENFPINLNNIWQQLIYFVCQVTEKVLVWQQLKRDLVDCQ